LKASPSALLALALAAIAVAGTVAVALATDAGGAPGSGQKVFDAPGCLPKAYHGPGRTGHYLLGRNCPTPTPVIVAETIATDRGYRVALDGSRSFDPMGGRLVEFTWDLGPGPDRKGRRITVTYADPGPHAVILYVTNDSGLTGTLREEISAP
jgi:PKD domain